MTDQPALEPISQELSSQESTSVFVSWSDENERILVEWCDIAKCYKWLHTRSHQRFSYMHAWFTIPAIILSTISGTASFAQGSLPVSMQTMAPMVIGSVNIFIGILTTIQQYLKISEYNESHRVSAIAWDKYARNIRIELAKHPDERSTDAGRFLKTNREEFDRLMETSPSIPISITNEFLETFSGQPKTWLQCCSKKKDTLKATKKEEMTKKAAMFEKLKKPDVCNIIVSTDDDRHPWYKVPAPLPLPPPSTPTNKNEELIYSVVSQKITKMQEDYEKRIASRIKEENEKRINAEREKIQQQADELNMNNIQDYVKKFTENYGRPPLKDEIEGALNNTIDDAILSRFLDTYSAEDDNKV